METQKRQGWGVKLGSWAGPLPVHLLAAAGLSLVPAEPLHSLMFAASVHASRPFSPVSQAPVCFHRFMRVLALRYVANVTRKFGPAL